MYGLGPVPTTSLSVDDGDDGDEAARPFPFPPADSADDRGRVVIGGDLSVSTVLAAYRSGLFPMRQGDGRLAWWSPDPRAVLTPANLHVSHSLERAMRRFEIRVDTALETVIESCAQRDPGEYHWITDEVRTAFVALHRLGWAHSVEAWSRPPAGEAPQLVGGLYGVAIGRFFGGESMFHRQRDASKVALVALVGIMAGEAEGEAGAAAGVLIDSQWLTPHLASLGAVEISRSDYLARLSHALALPLPAAFARRRQVRDDGR